MVLADVQDLIAEAHARSPVKVPEVPKVKHARTSCFGASLLVGVEVTCLVTLLVQIVIIAACSSVERLQILGVIFAPGVQVLAASWAFVGIPIVVAAGVGALYRIEENLRVFFYYMTASMVLSAMAIFWILTHESFCDEVVAHEIRRIGSTFVCGFTDALVLTWGLIGGMLHTYQLYIIWSLAEDIALAPYPELMRYSDALGSIRVPSPPVGADPASDYAVPEPELAWDTPVASGYPNRASSGYGGNGYYQPQSFVPSPQSGVDFNSVVY